MSYRRPVSAPQFNPPDHAARVGYCRYLVAHTTHSYFSVNLHRLTRSEKL
jgi:hypothetical protein